MAVGGVFVVCILLLVTGIYASEQSDEIQAAIFQRLAVIEDAQAAVVSNSKALETKVNDLEKKNSILVHELNRQNIENEQLKNQMKTLTTKLELISGTLNGHLSSETPSLNRRQARMLGQLWNF